MFKKNNSKTLREKKIFILNKTLIISIIILIISSIFVGIFLGVFFGTGGYRKNSVNEIVYVPDSTIVNDNGFNEATYDGVEEYSQNSSNSFSTLIPSNNYYSNSQWINSFETAFNSGYQLIVQNNSTLTSQQIQPLLASYPNKTMINVNDSNLSMQGTSNGISVYFSTQEEGFLAGLASSVYMTSSELNGYLTPLQMNVNTLSGFPEESVYSAMSGYQQAIDWWNYAILGYNVWGQPLNNLGNLNSVNNKNTYSFSNRSDLYNNVYSTSLTNAYVVQNLTQLNEAYLNNDFNVSLDLSQVMNNATNIILTPISLTQGQETNTILGNSQGYLNSYYQQPQNNQNFDKTNINSSSFINYSNKNTQYWYTNGWDASGEQNIINAWENGNGAHVFYEIGTGWYIWSFMLTMQDSGLNVSKAQIPLMISSDQDITTQISNQYIPFVLGSTIKNITKGTELATWYAYTYTNYLLGANLSEYDNGAYCYSNSTPPEGQTELQYQSVCGMNPNTNYYRASSYDYQMFNELQNYAYNYSDALQGNWSTKATYNNSGAINNSSNPNSYLSYGNLLYGNWSNNGVGFIAGADQNLNSNPNGPKETNLSIAYKNIYSTYTSYFGIPYNNFTNFVQLAIDGNSYNNGIQEISQVEYASWMFNPYSTNSSITPFFNEQNGSNLIIYPWIVPYNAFLS